MKNILSAAAFETALDTHARACGVACLRAAGLWLSAPLRISVRRAVLKLGHTVGGDNGDP